LLFLTLEPGAQIQRAARIRPSRIAVVSLYGPSQVSASATTQPSKAVIVMPTTVARRNAARNAVPES
jgi:hypothetical protein